MNMEHDIIMEEKLKIISERLEQWVLDTFITVLSQLTYHPSTEKEVKDDDMPF